MRTDGRFLRRLDLVAGFGLLAWLVFDLTARTVFVPVPWPKSVIDYEIMYDAGREVWIKHRYPSGYPYPPSAVAIHVATTALPFPRAAAVWLIAVGIAATACYISLARLLGFPARPGTLALLPLAHTAAAYYFQWDMRSLNCNLFVLASVLFGGVALTQGRDRAAGFWFALAVALKFLPVLLLPYLLWIRRRRAFVSAVVWSAVLWLLVPLIAFGWEGFGPVYTSWLGEFARTTNPEEQHPILISLTKAARAVTGGAAVPAIVATVCGVWLLVGAVGAGMARTGGERSGVGIATDVSLLLIGPAAVSPYLEAYHLVAACVPAAVLLSIAAEPGRSRRFRVFAFAVTATAAVLVTVRGPWPLRGFVVNLQTLLLCGSALWAVRFVKPDAASRGASREDARRIPVPAPVCSEGVNEERPGTAPGRLLGIGSFSVTSHTSSGSR